MACIYDGSIADVNAVIVSLQTIIDHPGQPQAVIDDATDRKTEAEALLAKMNLYCGY